MTSHQILLTTQGPSILYSQVPHQYLSHHSLMFAHDQDRTNGKQNLNSLWQSEICLFEVLGGMTSLLPYLRATYSRFTFVAFRKNRDRTLVRIQRKLKQQNFFESGHIWLLISSRRLGCPLLCIPKTDVYFDLFVVGEATIVFWCVSNRDYCTGHQSGASSPLLNQWQ
jgi:hypothetical protein